MADLGVFANPRFSPQSLTRAARLLPYVPSFLGSLNLFGTPDRITETFIELRRINGKVTLIPTTERGGEPVIGTDDTADGVFIKTPRLAKRQRKQAHSIQNLRSIDNYTELQQVQDSVTRIQATQRQDMEMTWELHRFGALQGVLYDADGTTVLCDFFQRFGVTKPTPIVFDFADPGFDVRGACTAVVRGMYRASRGSVNPLTRIMALADDVFFDALIKHPTVVDTYRYQEGAALRRGAAFSSFVFGDIEWVNYRGSDDGTKIAIKARTAQFFPINAPDVYGVATSPFESADFVNTPGEDVYSIVVWDEQRRFWWQPEIYSYPLHYCRQPEILYTGTYPQ